MHIKSLVRDCVYNITNIPAVHLYVFYVEIDLGTMMSEDSSRLEFESLLQLGWHTLYLKWRDNMLLKMIDVVTGNDARGPYILSIDYELFPSLLLIHRQHDHK